MFLNLGLPSVLVNCFTIIPSFRSSVCQSTMICNKLRHRVLLLVIGTAKWGCVETSIHPVITVSLATFLVTFKIKLKTFILDKAYTLPGHHKKGHAL